MMKKTNLATTIAALLVGSLAATTAQATSNASAESVVTVQNLVFDVGGVQMDYVGNHVTGVSTTETDTASIGTSNTTVNTITPTYAAQPQSIGVTAPAPLGATNITALNNTGDVAGAINNNIANGGAALLVSNLPLINANLAAAASNELGSPFTNTPTGPGTTTGSTSSATLYSGSYAGSTNGSFGSDQHSDLSVSFTITGVSGRLDILGNIGSYAAAFLSTGGPGSAYATYNVDFTVYDSTTNKYILDSAVASNTSNPSGTGTAIPAPTVTGYNTTTGVLNLAPAFDFNTGTTNLVSTDSYILTGTLHTDANVSAVPEPETLALLGIGLLGMGSLSRKFGKKAI